jgi:protein gp37
MKTVLTAYYDVTRQEPFPNVWLGTSIESDVYAKRADELRDTPADVRFISAEPLLGPLMDLDLTDIDWLIAGGESGPHARPMAPNWVRMLREQCADEGTAFFFKQWGGRTPTSGGRDLDGRTWDDMPVAMTASAPAERHERDA